MKTPRKSVTHRKLRSVRRFWQCTAVLASFTTATIYQGQQQHAITAALALAAHNTTGAAAAQDANTLAAMMDAQTPALLPPPAFTK